MGKDILLFVGLVKHRACSRSIIVLYSAGCYFAAVDYDGGNKEYRQNIVHVGRYIEQEGADDFVVQNHGSGSVSEDCRTDCN